MFKLAKGDRFPSEGQEPDCKVKNGIVGHGRPLLPPPREPRVVVQKD